MKRKDATTLMKVKTVLFMECLHVINLEVEMVVNQVLIKIM